MEVLALTLSQPQHKPPYLPNRGNFTLFTLSQPGKIHSYHIKRLYCLSPSLSPSSGVAVIRSDSKQFDIIKVIFGSFGGNISHVGASPLQGDRIGKKNARIAGFPRPSSFGCLKGGIHFYRCLKLSSFLLFHQNRRNSSDGFSDGFSF